MGHLGFEYQEAKVWLTLNYCNIQPKRNKNKIDCGLDLMLWAFRALLLFFFFFCECKLSLYGGEHHILFNKDLHLQAVQCLEYMCCVIVWL